MPVVPDARTPPAEVIASAGFTVIDEVVADFVEFLMLVAVTVTVEATAAVAVKVVAGELPAAIDGLTVPPPTTANVAPEPLASFATAAVKANVWPESRVMPVVGVENAIAIGVKVIVADADLLESLTLVAVSTAVVEITGFAEV